MTTADMAMIEDPAYRKVSEHFHQNPDEFGDAFARAWFKLTHRDMGPKSRYVGSEVPSEDLLWQDPLPDAGKPLSDADIAALKQLILDSEITANDAIFTAWASASTYRGSDYRGGANGARIQLAPQNQWQANDPERIEQVISTLKTIQQNSGIEVSLADLVVLAGTAAIESAASSGGFNVDVPFTSGRVDASQEQTDEEGFAVLEPIADGFRNFVKNGVNAPAEELLIDKAQLLGLTAPEMTALVGGLRVLNANHSGSQQGVFTSQPGVLSTDFLPMCLI